MKKWIFISAFIILIIGVAGWYFFSTRTAVTDTKGTESNQITYRCDNGREIKASFSDGLVDFSLSDGRSFTLSLVSSGSDAKFSNRDGSVVLWAKDYSAFLEENEESTYTGCVVYPLSFPSVGE